MSAHHRLCLLRQFVRVRTRRAELLQFVQFL